MKVIKHESNTKNTKKSFCYDESTKIIQYSEEILNELNTTRRADIPKYNHFNKEMEKIDSGDSSNLPAVKLDEYFGSLGLETESDYEVIEKGERTYGIC